MSKRAFLSSIVTLVLIMMMMACVHDAPAPIAAPKTDDLAQLANFLAGTFSSLEQSKKDQEYFNIRLVMFPIWKERTDGYWLYVEQAVAGHEATPYRQRVYHVMRDESGSIASVVYTLPDPRQFVGSYSTPSVFNTLAPENLTEREGCTIFLKRVGDDTFKGGTEGKECISDIKDAKYASSEVTITEKTLVSWDRGFDLYGKQAWGAERGGYVFDKTESFQW